VVNDADFLSFQQRLADLGDDRLGPIQGQRSARRDQLVERLSLDELAGDEQSSVWLLAEIEHAREPVALRALQLFQLALRALERCRAGQRRLRHDLVGDIRAVLTVARPPDTAAARAAQLVLQLVTLWRRRRGNC
jgi:hypothetical protein